MSICAKNVDGLSISSPNSAPSITTASIEGQILATVSFHSRLRASMQSCLRCSIVELQILVTASSSCQTNDREGSLLILFSSLPDHIPIFEYMDHQSLPGPTYTLKPLDRLRPRARSNLRPLLRTYGFYTRHQRRLLQQPPHARQHKIRPGNASHVRSRGRPCQKNIAKVSSPCVCAGRNQSA